MCQVYELERFKVVHVSRYAAPVLSLGLAPNCALLAVGLADGQLAVRRHSHNKGAVPGLPGAQPDKPSTYMLLAVHKVIARPLCAAHQHRGRSRLTGTQPASPVLAAMRPSRG